MKRALKWILLTLASLLVLAVITVGGYFCVKGYLMYRRAVERTPVSTIGSDIRSRPGFVSYDELPDIYVEAVIAVEDKRFESHCGIDIFAILRALWVDVTTLSFAEGGSTITQQLAKNELFTQEKRVERKIAEVFAAFAIERTYSKEEIFELYVNSIYFGNGYYGIHDAAMGYFGKSVSELTDAEAVMLAGLPNAPSIYTPERNPDLALRRTAVVLRRMVQCGKLTGDEADRIQSQAQDLFADIPAA